MARLYAAPRAEPDPDGDGGARDQQRRGQAVAGDDRAATTPKMGWVRKNAARPLGRYRFRSQRFASRPE